MFGVGAVALASQINAEICSYDVEIQINRVVEIQKVICLLAYC